jgi:flavin-dependent dehydrogenase
MVTPSRAVVVGAGMAGLVAARVLSDAVDEVLLLDRDIIADGGAPGSPVPVPGAARPGVPQAGHIHVLLGRGYRELTRLLPGLDGRLAAAGAPVVDWIRDTVWVTPGGQAPRRPSPYRSRSMSRLLLERTVRELVLERPNIELRAGNEVTGLLREGAAVAGVRCRLRPRGPAGERRVEGDQAAIPAWLVVDASGRSSRLPEMLDEAGFPRPLETVVDASLRYATRLYRRPEAAPDWRVLLVRDRPPSGTRGGGIMAIEDGRWLVTLGGAGRQDHPPTDEVGFLEFARSLISPLLHEAIAAAEPLTDVRGWARMANRWRHYERLPMPPGLAIVGDSLCALNPVYGQGMSVAAMEGAVLAAWLRSPGVGRARATGDPPPTQPQVREAARTARLPWVMAAGEDARIPGVQGAPQSGPLASVLGRYIDEVQLVAARDPYVQRRFLGVTQLVSPPVALADPVVLWKVLGAVVRRR